MRIVTSVVLQVIAIALLCLACAVVWLVLDVNRTIEADATSSADRVVREVQEFGWRELTWRGSAGRNAKYAFPDWRGSDVLRVISPGYCVTITWLDETPRRLCGNETEVSPEPPEIFVRLYTMIFGESRPVERHLLVNRRSVGTVSAVADHAAVLRKAWRQVSVEFLIAATMSGGICLLVVLVVGHALMPAEIITGGLRRLETGDLTVRLPAFRTREFQHIARAFNDLTGRLALTTQQRATLTKRLFIVQEEERRSLGRDLHDEFGQCLTATSALAGAIAAGTRGDRPDIAEDAGEIGVLTERMMQTLRNALARLRPPELTEMGLVRCLDHLVATWNARSFSPQAASTAPSSGSARPVFRFDIVGDPGIVPEPVALALYRIAQECLTNAVRHGRPSEVKVRIVCASEPARAVSLIVEDDGGGDPADLTVGGGHGILGIRERVVALGGVLSFGAAPMGIRIEATIPCAAGSVASHLDHPA